MMNRSDPSVSLSRVVAYLRKSRADGEESVEEVLAKHEKILQDYAVRTWGAPLPESRLFREVQSGETIAARPVMQKLLGMVQNREIDAVLVVELQRLSRGDLLDVGTLSQIFYFSKCLILTPSRTWNLEDEFDRKFFELELQHGRDYLEYIKRIMTRGRERSAMDGNYIGSRRPYGYERVVVDKKPTLAVVPSEAEVVRLIFEQKAVRTAGKRKNRRREKAVPDHAPEVHRSPLRSGILPGGDQQAPENDHPPRQLLPRKVLPPKMGRDPHRDGDHFQIIISLVRGRMNMHSHDGNKIGEPENSPASYSFPRYFSIARTISAVRLIPASPAALSSLSRNPAGRASITRS